MDYNTNNCQGDSDRKLSAYISHNQTTKYAGPRGRHTQERCYRK
jgi:hypothetical protein